MIDNIDPRRSNIGQYGGGVLHLVIRPRSFTRLVVKPRLKTPGVSCTPLIQRRKCCSLYLVAEPELSLTLASTAEVRSVWRFFFLVLSSEIYHSDGEYNAVPDTPLIFIIRVRTGIQFQARIMLLVPFCYYSGPGSDPPCLSRRV